MKLTLTLPILLLAVTAAALPYSECPPQWATPPPPCETCPCPPGGGGPAGGGGPSGCTSCGPKLGKGMPIWEVREAQVDYRLFDTPLHYTPAYGPPIALNLTYQTRRYTDNDYYPDNDANPLFGPMWHCAWSSDLVINGPTPWGAKTYWNYLGGRVFFDFGADPLVSDPAYPAGSRVVIVKDANGNVLGGRVYATDGHVFEYLRAYSSTRFVLTALFEPDGHALTFSYDAQGRISQITAATGQVTTFVYGDPSNSRFATQVTAPEGYIATFTYQSGYLASITDTEGIISTFTYTPDPGTSVPAVTALTTPHGTTTFESLWSHWGMILLVSEPEAVQHLYLQGDLNYTPPVPGSFPPSVIPSGLPLSTLDTSRTDRNTFYWGPSQLAAIGNINVDNWTWNEFKRARIRHWLGHHDGLDNHKHISHTLSWEQAPSPDGIAVVQS